MWLDVSSGGEFQLIGWNLIYFLFIYFRMTGNTHFITEEVEVVVSVSLHARVLQNILDLQLVKLGA